MDTVYYIYILRCTDDSFYTGITTDVQRRFEQHCGQRAGSAKYTRAHPPIRVECVWRAPDRRSASRLEYRIKALTRSQKEQLIASPEKLQSFWGESLETDIYCAVRF